MTHTDTQLKQALAKMLPEKVECIESLPMCRKELPNSELINGAWRHHSGQYTLHWKHDVEEEYNRVLYTELLHLCWLVEDELTDVQYSKYVSACHISASEQTDNYKGARNYLSATWQQRTIALCKVKGVAIV